MEFFDLQCTGQFLQDTFLVSLLPLGIPPQTDPLKQLLVGDNCCARLCYRDSGCVNADPGRFLDTSSAGEREEESRRERVTGANVMHRRDGVCGEMECLACAIQEENALFCQRDGDVFGS